MLSLATDGLLADSSAAMSALRWLLDVALQGTLLLALACIAALLLRRASGAQRHLVWVLALGGLLALPLLNAVVPGRQMLLRSQIAAQSGPVFPLREAAPVGAEAAASPRPAEVMSDASGESFGAWLRESWPLCILGVWLGGMIVVGARVAFGLRGLHRLERESVLLSDGPLVEQARQAQQSLRLQRPFMLRLARAGADEPSADSTPADGVNTDAAATVAAGNIAVPLTWGWRRPVVLLPAGAEAWPALRRRAVLLHELAHVARGDWAMLLAAQAACALFWFHPLAWLAARSLRLEGERATDDRVLAAGVRAGDYGECLLDFVRLLSATQRRPIMKLAIAMARPSTLEDRLRALLDPRRNRRGVSRLNFLLGAGLTAVIALGVATVRVSGQAQDTAPGATTAAASGVASAAVDLSSPEATVRSFVAALDRVDLRAASACVAGGKPASQLSRLKPMLMGFEKSTVTVVSLQEETAGAASTVSFQLAMDGGAANKGTMSDRLPLRRYADGWKIVPGKPASLSKRQYMASLLPFATAIARPQTLASWMNKTEEQVCLSNMKQLGLAGVQFLADHRGKFTLKTATAKKSLEAYYPGIDRIFHCPQDKSGADSYAFNRNLEGVRATDIAQPQQTVMLYDGKNGRLAFRHNGRAVVAFADGHVELVSRQQAKSLRWKP